jgi:DNA primase
MASDAVAEIKSRLDIVEVVGGYVRLQRSGRSHKGLCPFHSEKTPSFSVDQQRQAWYCFGCNEGGDVFTFVERIERVDFRQALEILSERAGVELEPRSSGERRGMGRRRQRAIELSRLAQAYYEYVLWETAVGEPGRALLRARDVAGDLARRFGIGFAPAGGIRGDALVEYLTRRGHGSIEEIVAAGLAHAADRRGARDRFRHRLVFPIRDERGQVLGFGGRALGEARPKYLNTPATDAYDKSTALFGIDLAKTAIAQARQVVVVEGYFDVVAAHAAGIQQTVASSGTALTERQVQLLARHTRAVVLCFDADDAGQAATRKAVDLIAAEGLEGRVCVMPGTAKDPDELVRADPLAFAACVAAAPREWQVLLDRALVEAESGSVEDRRAGAERAVAVLVRIPEATARDLYAQQVAHRLQLAPAAVAADVARAMAGPARGGATARLVVSLPLSPDAPVAATVDDEPDPGPIPAWERHIATLVVQRPALGRELVEGHGLRPDSLRTPRIRRLVEASLATPPGADLPFHRLVPADQALAARLLLRRLPELADDAPAELLTRSLVDCMWDARRAGLEAEIDAVQRERRLARESGRAAEAEELAVRYYRLNEERQHHLDVRPSSVLASPVTK